MPSFRRWAAPRPPDPTENACFRRNRVGEGEARPTGRTRTVKGSETGVARPAARSARTRPRRRRRQGRRLSFDFPGPVCWADKQSASCQGGGERAQARRSPALSIAQSETGASSGSRGSIVTLQASTEVKDGHNLFKVLGYCSQTGVSNDSRCIRPRQRILD